MAKRFWFLKKRYRKHFINLKAGGFPSLVYIIFYGIINNFTVKYNKLIV